MPADDLIKTLVRSMEASARFRGGGPTKIDKKTREAIGKVLDDAYKKVVAQDRDHVVTEATAAHCEDLGNYVPCDPLVKGQCPPEDMFGNGGELQNKPYAKLYEVQGNRRRRCIPKLLLNTGEMDDENHTVAGDSMNARLFKLWQGIGIIKKSWDESMHFNRTLIPDGINRPPDNNNDKPGRTIRASECTRGSGSREACEMLMQPREMGAAYGERCRWGGEENGEDAKCVPTVTNTDLTRPMMMEDLGEDKFPAMEYNLEDDAWTQIQGVNKVDNSTPPDNTQGPFGNERRVLISTDSESICYAIFRAAARQAEKKDRQEQGDSNAEKYRTEPEMIVHLWNSVTGRHPLWGGQSGKCVFSKVTDRDLGDSNKVITYLAQNYGNPNVFENMNNILYRFRRDKDTMLQFDTTMSPQATYKYMLTLMLAPYLSEPRNIVDLENRVKQDIIKQLVEHVSRVRYLASLAYTVKMKKMGGTITRTDQTDKKFTANTHEFEDNKIMSQNDLKFCVGTKHGIQGARGVSNVEKFAYANYHGERKADDNDGGHNILPVQREAVEGGGGMGNRNRGYDMGDYSAVILALIGTEKTKPRTVAQVVERCYAAMDIHWDTLENTEDPGVTSVSAPSLESVHGPPKYRDDTAPDRMDTYNSQGENTAKNLVDSVFGTLRQKAN